MNQHIKPFIEFRKHRDLGAIISDTFKFIRYEFKPLFSAILKHSGLALVILLIAYVFYERSLFSTIDNIGFLGSDLGSFTTSSFIALGIMLLAAFVFYILLYATILNYIKLYIANEGTIDTNQLKTAIWKNFGNMFGLGFLISIMTSIGFIFCIAPGIYLLTVFGTGYALMVFQQKSISDTINDSFSFVNKDWWITFATYIVLYILYYIITAIFQLPATVYTIINTMTVLDDPGNDATQLYDWVSTTLNVIAMIAQYLLHTIITITTAFVYFTLDENRNATGTLEAIEKIGNRESLNE